MNKIKFKPFWSYDVLKTQSWLDDLHQKGYELQRVNPFLRLFYFKESNQGNKEHKIYYDKGLNGYPDSVAKSSDYSKICFTKNFYFTRQLCDEPDVLPSYDNLLARNQKLKFIVGQVLLFLSTIYVFAFIVLAIFIFGSDGITVVTEPGSDMGYTSLEIIRALLFYIVNLGYGLLLIWMIYTFFKLRVSNKKLEEFCGEDIDLSFTIPTDTILKKEEIRALRKENKLIKKTRIAWFYSPDKAEEWLEGMEAKGYNLLRMGKIGNSFYFKVGEPRKVKYHVDYQGRKGSNYFSLNEESGWKLYFTSLTRLMSISVWGQEYEETVPAYYSDHESEVKHAKKFMWTYLAMYFPLILLLLGTIGMMISSFIDSNFDIISISFLLAPLMQMLLVVELLFFSFKLIRYYQRVKDAEL